MTPRADFLPAKHLEPLKGGKIALEVLVRGKDAEQNEALFRKIADKITGAGVSRKFYFQCNLCELT
jgi:hypothetical protein